MNAMGKRKAIAAAAVFTVFFSGFGAAIAAGLPPGETEAKSRLLESPRHGEWARVDAGGGDMVDLWVVYPERKDRAPVVLVIHEIFGLTDWIRSVADQLAADGFIAVAPDFLSGKGPGGKGSGSVDVDTARSLVRELDGGEIVRRLDAAARYATSLPAAEKRFATVGFCWGGAVSFAYATRQPELYAAVVYYGTSPAAETLAGIKAPVLGLYGGDDNRVNATIPDAEREMKRLGKRFGSEIYEGAGHGFLRAQDGREGANLRAAQKAWPRTVEFLKKALER
jgi:carboxymethylenebutenolidase